jgi:hypothetical protein
MRNVHTHKRSIPALALLVVLGAAGVGYAAIPSAGTGVIHGCSATSASPGILGIGEHPAGALSVIDADKGQTCPTGTLQVSWNQAGPQGPMGSRGDTGPTGPPGPAGPSGLAGATTATTSFTFPADDSYGDTKYAYATCPSGTTAINPSIANSSSNNGVNKAVTIVDSESQGSTWRAGVRNDEKLLYPNAAPSTISTTITLTVMCVAS